MSEPACSHYPDHSKEKKSENEGGALSLAPSYSGRDSNGDDQDAQHKQTFSQTSVS
ncbi:MAG TPA: hypothetical protein VIT89_08230 [Solirubrobacterales bacterium]